MSQERRSRLAQYEYLSALVDWDTAKQRVRQRYHDGRDATILSQLELEVNGTTLGVLGVLHPDDRRESWDFFADVVLPMIAVHCARYDTILAEPGLPVATYARHVPPLQPREQHREIPALALREQESLQQGTLSSLLTGVRLAFGASGPQCAREAYLTECAWHVDHAFDDPPTYFGSLAALTYTHVIWPAFFPEHPDFEESRDLSLHLARAACQSAMRGQSTLVLCGAGHTAEVLELVASRDNRALLRCAYHDFSDANPALALRYARTPAPRS